MNNQLASRALVHAFLCMVITDSTCQLIIPWLDLEEVTFGPASTLVVVELLVVRLRDNR
jgi:hypothetical protein